MGAVPPRCDAAARRDGEGTQGDPFLSGELFWAKCVSPPKCHNLPRKASRRERSRGDCGDRQLLPPVIGFLCTFMRLWQNPFQRYLVHGLRPSDCPFTYWTRALTGHRADPHSVTGHFYSFVRLCNRSRCSGQKRSTQLCTSARARSPPFASSASRGDMRKSPPKSSNSAT